MKKNIPFEIKKRYKKSLSGKMERSIKERGLFKKGYFVYSEEEVKQFNSGKGCLLAIIFLPLVLFGRSKYVDVVYRQNVSN